MLLKQGSVLPVNKVDAPEDRRGEQMRKDIPLNGRLQGLRGMGSSRFIQRPAVARSMHKAQQVPVQKRQGPFCAGSFCRKPNVSGETP